MQKRFWLSGFGMQVGVSAIPHEGGGPRLTRGLVAVPSVGPAMGSRSRRRATGSSVALVSLDRSLDGELAGVLKAAVGWSDRSLATSKGLSALGFPGPAYVWAVRSVEVLLKEFILLPLFLEELQGNWGDARAKVRQTFRSGEWTAAVKLVNDLYGPLDKMLTEDGQDVWQIWTSTVVPRRGSIVHGLEDCTESESALVIRWAEQMMLQLKLRLIVAAKHPLHDFFVSIIEQGRAAAAASPTRF